MYAVAASSFGGIKRGLTPDALNPYRKGRRASMADYFGRLRAMKAEQDQRQAANGGATTEVPGGGGSA
jgi:hypothetical protein